ncbi:MAG: FAD:protein FMN transferase [bacterium]|nr:FAD:protein FMN transferase [bacterium]MCP5067956.1 FAD:protein FMN transferase [bacterium]
MTPRARRLLPIFLLVLVALTARTLWCQAPGKTLLVGQTMGTSWSVTLVEPDPRAREAIQARLDAVNAAMSTWDPDSELSRFNAHASSEPFPLSSETLGVMSLAREVSEATGGAFDVTVRPLVAAWGFGAGARIPGAGPVDEDLVALRARVGFERLVLDPAGGTAQKRHPQLEVDLSAIAKGFGVDEVARALSELGHERFLVEVGGEVRALGERPAGGSWRLAIERPEPDGRAVHAVVELRDLAMATSGDYRSFYEQEGERLTHIVDPRVGRPVSHGLASVSVVHQNAATADAWATALTVLGPDEGPRVAVASGIAAYFIVRTPQGSYETRRAGQFPPVHAAGKQGR